MSAPSLHLMFEVQRPDHQRSLLVMAKRRKDRKSKMVEISEFCAKPSLSRHSSSVCQLAVVYVVLKLRFSPLHSPCHDTVYPWALKTTAARATSTWRRHTIATDSGRSERRTDATVTTRSRSSAIASHSGGRRHAATFSRARSPTFFPMRLTPLREHRRVPNNLTAGDLTRQYATEDALLAHAVISTFVDWVKTKPVDFFVRIQKRARVKRR